MLGFSNTRARTAEQTRFGVELVKRLSVPCFVLDCDGKVLVWNKACEVLTGLSAAAMVGTKDHWRGFYREERPCLADLVLNLSKNAGAAYNSLKLQDDGSARAENWCDLPSGGRRYLAIDAAPLRDEKGVLIGVVETLGDRTAEKVASEEVREGEALRERLAAEQKEVVERLAEGLKSLAAGRLDPLIVSYFPEDYKRLRMDFNQALTEIATVMRRIRESSQNVARASDEIAADSTALASKAEHQAAMLEETAAAHEQITTTVKKTLSVSRDAAAMIVEARTNAENSRQVVDEAVIAIKAIEKTASQISQIIGVIDEIAFQTNLLALNAGVEAARAGESGRGFAVVAQEVRALAQRSAEAAKEIRALITDSARAVNKGVDLVTTTGSNLHWIVDQVTEVSSWVQEIAHSAGEQSEALSEVNQAISQLDTVTQHNANVADRNAQSCSALTTEAVRLAGLVDHFTVKGDLVAEGPKTMNLDKAAEAHLAWRTKLLRAAETGERLDARTISADNCCELGKWLHADARTLFGGRSELADLTRAHAAFHCEAGKVAEVINRGDTRTAVSMLEAGTPYSNASQVVGVALHRLKGVGDAKAA